MSTKVAAGFLAGVTLALVASAQTKTTTLDKVYSAEQALRGAELYDSICAACHEGDEPEAAPPKGSEFIERWREAPLSFLHGFLKTSMPGDKPGSLSASNYVDVIAYLLEANAYPAGPAELTAAKMSEVWLVGTDGPKPLPANSLVSAVGCLTSNADGWTLTSGTAPLRVRVGDETTPEELGASRAAVLGTATYTLGNAEDFPSAKMAGHKVQAKGVLTRVANPLRLSVQSLETVGESCGK